MEVTLYSLIVENLCIHLAANTLYLCSGSSPTTMELLSRDPEEHVEMFTAEAPAVDPNKCYIKVNNKQELKQRIIKAFARWLLLT